MVVYDYTTGKWNAELDVGISRANITHPPILQDKHSLLSGYKGEVFTLLESGQRVQLLEDVLSEMDVATLRTQGKLVIVSNFKGFNE